jgi:hypothetical protein
MPKVEYPRIAIIGGCQVVGLAAATKLLVPDALVSAWHVGLHPEIDDASLFKELNQFDLIISQVSMYAGHELLDITTLRQAEYPVIYLPTIAFTGFHPDCSYIFCKSGVLKGYYSDLHSNIVISSYLLGLSEERARKLFNRFVYTCLGYRESFNIAKSAFTENFGMAGYPIEECVDRWVQESGTFMYTMNHPNIPMMADLCALALDKANLARPVVDVTDRLDDYLEREFIWPVYPDLLSKPSYWGSTIFKRSTHDTPPHEQREISLEAFIAGSYKIYASTLIDDLKTPQISVFADKLAEIIV